jgi:deferrochelatase/peroxidase EfeB
MLGYRNAYDVIPQSPTVPDAGAAAVLLPLAPADPTEADPAPRRDLGRNGTYMVFRQLEQDVKAFWRFADTRSGGDAERRKWLAAKMVGRWPNGASLVQEPDREPETFDAKRGNDFWYRGDLAGDRCPLGSHIRRSNPRDGMMPDVNDSLLVADRHRLLRRGRAYGRPLAETLDPGQMLSADDPLEGKRGLHFICFNTDIARQFEFVQNTWINSMKFDGQYHGPDPVVAPHVDPETHPEPEEVSNFVAQRCPVRHREKGVPRFVTMRGGAYLFMPGLRALQYLSRLG